jgi:ABC-2 type transport system permease protein
MVGWLQTISDVLPMSYAVEALTEVGAHPEATTRMWRDLVIVTVAAVVALMMGAATLRRRST